ncbi:MAG TPA: DUF924 family protein [Ramlibacter sp.]|jgi:uncharacterized protein (DUF924 family)|nr:DUF924 family protein [Ramlibacter sp.]
MLTEPQELLDFWRAAGPQRWFRADPAFDAELRDRFLAAHEAAARGELDWPGSAEGALALVLLLDQFPRNAFRGTARMYATDAQARQAAADAAIAAGFDGQVDAELRQFFYLPFMHSERLQDLERCVALNQSVGGEPLRFAQHHRDIVRRFGRFPHRNAVLGRETSAEEERFLAEGGFKG